MADICGDNRFELIEKYKQKLLDETNIGDSPEEMAVINNILFRFWQMGWFKGEPSTQPTEASCWGCNCPKMERLKEQKTFSEMAHLHDVEKTKGRKICSLKCLRCKQTYDYSWDTMDEISYTMYSYCPDCIRKGILLLKLHDKDGDGEEKE